MAWPVTLNGRTYTSADFDGVNYVDGLPDAFQDFVTHAASTMQGTSTSSVAIGTGSKSFTTQTGKVWAVGTPLRIASTASPSTAFMDGVVTSYNSGTGALVVNVVGITGTGTLAAWTISPGGGGYALSTPVTIALGGTGATTATAGLAALLGMPLAGGTFTGAVTLSGNPTADLHPASKGWIETRANKDACRVASTANVTISAPGTAIDGVTLGNGDRVLLKNQTAQAENGIYLFATSSTPMTRATDMDAWTDVPNAFSSVEEGTVNSNTIWLCQNTVTGTLGTTAITWQLVSNAQVAALGAVATTGFLNRTGANTFSTTSSATAATASTLVARDASANVTINDLVTGNGAVGAPAIRPSSDTNTGVRFSGSDGLMLVTGGVDRLTFDASGNYGVGVAPNNVADCRIGLIKGPNSGAGYAIVAVEGGTTTKQGVFQISGANGHIEIGTAVGNTTGNTALMSGGATRLTLTAGGDIEPGSAANIVWSGGTTHYVGFNPTVEHAAGNVGNMVFGTEDGGGWTGMTVTNFREGSVNSQQIDLITAKGAISLATVRARISSEGHCLFGPNAATTWITPGYNGNTTLGTSFWNSGRMFQSMDDFSQLNLQRSGGTTTGNIVIFSTQSSVIGAIWSNGTSTAYNTTSDYRLKQDIEPLTGALDRLDLLQPKRFRFKSDPAMEKVDGFLAHEAAVAVPESVSGEQDEEDFGGNPQYQGLDAAKLVPLLVAAVKELRAEFNAYKAAHP